MIRLIYISTARTILSQAALDEILRVSRRNNAAVAVTGLLIVGGRRFLQVLEGPSDAVMQTYHRIHADERHFAAVVLSNKPIAARTFGGWSMGFQSAGHSPDQPTIDDSVAALIAPIDDPVVHAYFYEFAKQHAA